MTQSLKLHVGGMDCAACVAKIEKAVQRIAGVTDVKVGLQSETLSATVGGAAQAEQVAQAVRDLGYKVQPKGAAPAAAGKGGEHHHDDDGHDHSDHGEPIEGAWWESSKGILVIVTGVMIAFAYGEQALLPYGSTLVFWAATLVGTFPVARRALAALRAGSFFTIEMLMTIAVIGALAINAVEEAAIVVFLFAVGELLEGIAAGRARSGIKALAKIAPQTAMVETPGGLVETPIEQIALRSIVVARPGDRIPADGIIVSGTSSVDESALTGESVPRSKTEGDTVLAGSINTEAVLRIRVEKAASETVIARVVALVEEAADAKAPSERFIDQFARWYMPVICLLALAVALVPPLLMQQPWDTWLYRALGLLLIGCPCALVISTPASIASALAAGARRGLLVKGGGVLEAIGKVKHIAFDKTGTLTEGKPRVTDVVALGKLSETDVLRMAASAESGSSHPLALAILNHAKAKGVAFAPVPSTAIPGKGLSAKIDGKLVLVGAAARIGVKDENVLARAAALEAEGKSVAAILSDDVPVGLIAMRDEPRDDAVKGVATIKALGLSPVMLTGDNRANAEAVGKLLGMEVKAELLPEDKLAVIKERAVEGGIAKVGDGINDAPALAAATVGIAMGSGTDVALEAADAAVLNNRIGDIAALIGLSRKTLAVIRQNVTIALGLKVVFLVTTVLGITGLWIAILADTGATVLVTANALRLLRFRAA
ncbi:MAG: cadmium-translocating P-type ATPase [Proteobacteria bacterium]|nr:cadmium-translocating P-type ATPase [Pseudomonadota bacterium]